MGAAALLAQRSGRHTHPMLLPRRGAPAGAIPPNRPSGTAPPPRSALPQPTAAHNAPSPRRLRRTTFTAAVGPC